MSVSRYYHMCSRGVGRPVQIRMVDGRVHRGIIDRVTPNKVFLRPLGRGRNLGGFGYGYYGYRGWGWGWGFGLGLALGAIVTLAFIF